MARPKAGITFWDRVYQHVVRNGECELFMGHRDECGYGRIYRDGKLVRIHRAVWERDNGPIQSGKEICHTCDTPNRIFPQHLFAGTHGDNMRDMWTKGRGENLRLFGNTHTRGKHINVGSSHGGAIFTEDKVRNIKVELRANNNWQTVEKLAVQHKCSTTAINHIRRGTRWKHVQ